MLPVLYSIGMIFVTAIVHAISTMMVLEWMRSISGRAWAVRSALTRMTAIGSLVMVMSLASFLESALWAFLYMLVDAIPDLGSALYFSLVTFTSLGYGDIVLTEPWRILAAFEAVNGVIMFGWTTAIIVAVAHRLYLQHHGDG